MLAEDWSYRAVSVVMESHTGPGRFSFYGANHPDVIEEVHARRVDVSTLNPAALLTMAHRGTGAFDSPRDVATIAVLPHDDQLGFAVADRLGFTSLDRHRRAPGTRCGCRSAARSTRARRSWWTSCCARTGSASTTSGPGAARSATTSPCPTTRPGSDGSQRGEIDAIFDEGVIMWADQVAARRGPRSCRSSFDHLEVLQAQGFRRGLIEKSRYPSLPGDIPTVDYSGWPIYCRTDTPDALIEQFCQALVSRREHIVWDIGGVRQPPLPLERMVRESPVTPQDVPMHPRAAAVWREHGYLP